MRVLYFSGVRYLIRLTHIFIKDQAKHIVICLADSFTTHYCKLYIVEYKHKVYDNCLIDF